MVTCATTSRVRQPSHNEGAFQTAAVEDSNRSAKARYSSANATPASVPPSDMARSTLPLSLAFC